MNPKMSESFVNRIVHPEPQSSVRRNAWKYFPSWVQLLAAGACHSGNPDLDLRQELTKIKVVIIPVRAIVILSGYKS
jgi:hypothetical protein